MQIDIDGRMLNIRYPMELGLIGDAKADARGADPARRSTRRTATWREQIEGEIADWWRLIEERALQDADPINPQRLFWELNDHLPDDAILAADSGSSRELVRARRSSSAPSHLASLSGTLATMGPGVPYAIAAKFAHPNRPARRARRRRRDADERDGRADHRREVLRPLGRPAARSSSCSTTAT